MAINLEMEHSQDALGGIHRLPQPMSFYKMTILCVARTKPDIG